MPRIIREAGAGDIPSLMPIFEAARQIMRQSGNTNSLPDVHGIWDSMVSWAFERTNTLRVDTHRDNQIMQHNFLKHGFTYCGIIYLANGDERLAYQKIISE